MINLLVSLLIRVPVVQKSILWTIYFSLIKHLFWFQDLEKENCNVGLQNNQVERCLRRSLIQPSAQSRVNSKIRPGFSELYPVRSWKHPMMETAQALGSNHSLAWLSSWQALRFLWSGLLQPLLTGQVLEPPWLSDPHLNSIQFISIFFVLGTPSSVQYPRCSLMTATEKG